VHYGCNGFVFHHNADLWRAAAPVDGSWGLWPVGGAWLALQTWEHYAFSLDTEFLHKTAYPALKESAEFMLSFLIEIPMSCLRSARYRLVSWEWTLNSSRPLRPPASACLRCR